MFLLTEDPYEQKPGGTFCRKIKRGSMPMMGSPLPWVYGIKWSMMKQVNT